MGFLSNCLHLGLSLMGDHMERALGQSQSEIERLRCQLDSERRDLDAARAVIAGHDLLRTSANEILEMQRKRIEELEALLARLTPRTYREGDPRPDGHVPWWHTRWGWTMARSTQLNPGDIYIDPPPPSEWPQPWTGGSGPLDPAQQHAYDALQKVTKERDEAQAALQGARKGRAVLEEALSEAQGQAADAEQERDALRDALRDHGEVTAKAWQERDEARDELARLRALLARLTPRICEGEPQPKGATWWNGGSWHGLAPGYLALGDIYLDLPPPSEWPQPWTGSSGPLDPAQQHAYDALERVTKERDALREAHREAQEALRDQEAATAKVTQERERARGWASLWHLRAASYRRTWRIVAAAWDSARAEMLKAWQECDRLKAELAALRSHHDEARAELARLRERPSPNMVEEIIHGAKMDQLRRRIADLAAALGTKPEGQPDDWHRLIGKVCDLREQTTPRRDPPPKRHIWWDAESHMWYGTSYGRRSESEWWLPQPPPPPDEAWQESGPPARGRTEPWPGSQE